MSVNAHGTQASFVVAVGDGHATRIGHSGELAKAVVLIACGECEVAVFAGDLGDDAKGVVAITNNTVGAGDGGGFSDEDVIGVFGALTQVTVGIIAVGGCLACGNQWCH